MRLRSPSLSAALLVLTAAGCASSAPVRTSKQVPLQRVVLYRNGVGYFERHGEFRGDSLRFGVLHSDVGDFLASLTAVEHGEGQVRSISFEADDVAKGKATDRVDVRLRLSGKRHRMTVSYVVGAPIWRPSYRIVLDDKGALLQAWAVVQNFSGEDWKDVRLSLTTGAPIAFESDLGTPMRPTRPRVTDEGEVVLNVPGSQTALDEETAGGAPAMEPSADLGGFDDYPKEEAEELDSRHREYAKRAPMSRSAGAMPSPSAAPPPSITSEGAARTVAPAAAVALLPGGITRYDLAHPVTVPDGGSTMVALLSKRISGESAHLFAPDGGVPESHRHPFRVARIKNETGAALERGPVSVLGGGDFFGQGVLDPLPRGATSFLPFALDRSLTVERSEEYGQAEARLIRVVKGQITVERFASRKTRFVVRNGRDETSKVYVKHALWPGASLHRPPAGVEVVGDGTLVPITVKARAKATVELEERTPTTQVLSFFDETAAEAIRLYLEGAAVNAAEGPALKRALQIRAQLYEAQTQIRTMERERAELERSANEARANLEAIKKIDSAADLRARLVARLSEIDRQHQATSRALVERRMQESELRVRLEEALADVTLDVR